MVTGQFQDVLTPREWPSLSPIAPDNQAHWSDFCIKLDKLDSASCAFLHISPTLIAKADALSLLTNSLELILPTSYTTTSLHPEILYCQFDRPLAVFVKVARSLPTLSRTVTTSIIPARDHLSCYSWFQSELLKGSRRSHSDRSKRSPIVKLQA